MPIQAPSQWTSEVLDVYEPVKTLGQGGFASVVLARSRNDSSQLAAMKVVGGKNRYKEKENAALARQQVGYAHREFEILSELSHPNIMKLLHHWEDATTKVVVMALSYASGPTLHALLLKGGRLNFSFARVVSAQLIDAVAYLHSRAVIHRDIKPDNIIVTGATFSQNEIWDDPKPSVQLDVPTERMWQDLLAKWHITIIDFGFARALSPSDFKSSSSGGQPQRLDDSSSSASISGNMRRRSSIDRSVTRRFTRMMSAVGNRAYAAPEVQRGVVEREPSGDLSRSGNFDKQQSVIDVTKTLSTHVSFYGLNADAYSVGNTMLHMFTGARPDENVNELLALENSPVIMLGRLLCSSCSSSDTVADGSHRIVRYRRVSDIDPEPLRLIRGLTHADPNQRTTVRTARLHPYVEDILVGRQGYQTYKTVEYLQCVLKRDKTIANELPVVIDELAVDQNQKAAGQASETPSNEDEVET